MIDESKSREVRGLENTIDSLRAQMKQLQKQAAELAEAVDKALFETKGFGVSIINGEAAHRAYELAREVLA